MWSLLGECGLRDRDADSGAVPARARQLHVLSGMAKMEFVWLKHCRQPFSIYTEPQLLPASIVVVFAPSTSRQLTLRTPVVVAAKRL